MLQSVSEDDGTVQSKRYQKTFQYQVGNRDYMQKAVEKLLEIRPLPFSHTYLLLRGTHLLRRHCESDTGF